MMSLLNTVLSCPIPESDLAWEAKPSTQFASNCTGNDRHLPRFTESLGPYLAGGSFLVQCVANGGWGKKRHIFPPKPSNMQDKRLAGQIRPMGYTRLPPLLQMSLNTFKHWTVFKSIPCKQSTADSTTVYQHASNVKGATMQLESIVLIQQYPLLLFKELTRLPNQPIIATQVTISLTSFLIRFHQIYLAYLYNICIYKSTSCIQCKQQNSKLFSFDTKHEIFCSHSKKHFYNLLSSSQLHLSVY